VGYVFKQTLGPMVTDFKGFLFLVSPIGLLKILILNLFRNNDTIIVVAKTIFLFYKIFYIPSIMVNIEDFT
jgi:hypothetical protein